jgi:hypothetical protein
MGEFKLVETNLCCMSIIDFHSLRAFFGANLAVGSKTGK